MDHTNDEDASVFLFYRIALNFSRTKFTSSPVGPARAIAIQFLGIGEGAGPCVVSTTQFPVAEELKVIRQKLFDGTVDGDIFDSLLAKMEAAMKELYYNWANS